MWGEAGCFSIKVSNCLGNEACRLGKCRWHVAVSVFTITQTEKLNPLTADDLKRRRAVSLLKIKIPSKNIREKPTNTPIIHSVY
jgi:hypothetical protein